MEILLAAAGITGAIFLCCVLYATFLDVCAIIKLARVWLEKKISTLQ